MTLSKKNILFLLFISICITPRINAQSTNKKLFTLLNAKDTKVTFENTIVDKKEHNILIYSNYYGGAGVGIGDFNKDGLPDLYFAGNLVADRLYINKGNFIFEDITQSAGIQDNGGWSSGVVIADINADGLDDIYVCRELYDDNPELRKNKLYINQGNLIFKEMAANYGLDDDARTRHATFLDYDNDNDLDLFLLNQPPNPGNYSDFYGTDLTKEEYSPRLYRNNGNQTFTDVTKEANLLKTGYPNSVTASDFNKDGWTDIYVANDFEAPDFLYLNQGNGSFKEVTQKSLKTYFIL